MTSQAPRRLPYPAAALASAYGAAHLWALADPQSPWVPPEEPFAPGRWAPATLGLLAATVCLLIARGIGGGRTNRRWALVGLGWVAGGGLVLYSYMLAISLVATVFADYDQWASLLTRTAGTVGGVLTLACVVAEQQRLRRACAGCGRVHGRSPERRTDPAPRWAFLGAYGAVSGCAARVTVVVSDHVAPDGPPLPAVDSPFTLFLALMILAGTVLPLALVHRWGRIWPRWVVPLAGRRVPRWLVLGPAWFVGASLTGYFGVAGMAAWMLGKGNLAEAPLWSVSMEMFGYTVWGVGLLVAAVSYHALTRPPCPLREPLGEDHISAKWGPSGGNGGTAPSSAARRANSRSPAT